MSLSGKFDFSLHLDSQQQWQNYCILAKESNSGISSDEVHGQAAKFGGMIIGRYVYVCDSRNYTRTHKTSIQHCHRSMKSMNTVRKREKPFRV